MSSPSPEEFELCRWDPVRWARVYLGINLHPGQQRMVRAYMQRTSSRWRALYLWLMIAAGNRAGKTLALAIIILHSCVFRIGLPPPTSMDPKDVERWGKLPYHWWHFAIEQGPAEQVFSELTTILAGTHPAQKAGCPWSMMIGEGDAAVGAGKIATTDVKERGEYAWIKLHPDMGGAEIHFRSTKAKALGSLGQNMHGLSFDEAGLETNLEYLTKEVLHARRLGTGGQFILISTPSAATSTDFEDLWFTGDPEDPFREERRFAMRMSSRDNIGYGLDRESFNSLVKGMPEDWVAQNIDGEFIQASAVWFNANSVRSAFREDLDDEDPIQGSIYAQALDPGLKDKCWSLTFRMLPNGDAAGVNIERMQGKQTTRGIVELGARVHRAYEVGSFIETGVDTTSLGGHMFREMLEESIPVKSVEFGGMLRVKRQLLSDLRTAFDEGRIKMPATGFWLEARRQCLNYKLADRKLEQDLVMALAIIVKLMRASPRVAKSEPVVFDYNLGHAEVRRDDGISSGSIRAKMAEKRRRQRAIDASPAETDNRA